MNRILKRQFKRHFGKDFDIESLDTKMQNFFENVEETYHEFEKEKRFLENTLDINSDELYKANQQIAQKNKNLNKLLDNNAKLLENRIEENRNIETKLKQYKLAMDTALLVNTFDANGLLTFVNDNFSILSGFSPSELIGKRNPLFNDSIFITINAKELWTGVLEYRTRNNNIYNLNATIFPIFNSKHEIVEFMSIFQDITTIEASRQKALELDKAKSLFIANMSHELRTPLNSIIGFSQILRRQKKIPEKVQDYIEKINFSGEHLLKLINSILDFSKIEAGEVTLENIAIDLYAIITTTLVQQETQAKQKNIALELEYNESLPRLFLGDSLRITQILTNLISNALKFTEKGSVKVIVTQEHKHKIQIAVKDTGIGLSDADKTKLFKEFSQADNSTSRKYGGTGLGLSISKELVELMGGKIWIESTKGEGSSFIFEMSLEKIEKTEDILGTQKIADYSKYVPFSELQKIQDAHILVVEDNMNNQYLISSLLEETQIKVHIANNGLEALNMINHRKVPYTLILMDMQMPIMNGLEASIEIRREDTHVPIIALSANISEKDVKQAKAIGINEYLFKPLNQDILYTCLFNYLH